MFNKISTPCIGVCSTIYGDDICRGCHRNFEEIIKWNQLSQDERLTIQTRLDNLQNKFSKKYFEITDRSLLIKSLIDFKINHRNSENNFSLAYKLVKKLGNKLKAEGIEQYGVSIKYLTEKLTINQILTEIDEDIYKESEENFNTII
jgi:predicted Fe-S protein YdhL (DUF1289 family)